MSHPGPRGGRKRGARGLNETHSRRLLHEAVARKWPSAERKEWWYVKYRAALRGKTTILHQRQVGLCHFCHNPTYLRDDDKGGLSKKRKATADHVVPQSRGGTDRLTNLVMACAACNHLRGDMAFQKFQDLRSSPERWAAHCREIQRRVQKKRGEVRASRDHKRVGMAWRIGVLLYLRPEWNVVVEEVRREFGERIRASEERLRRRVENSMVDAEDFSPRT